METGLRSFRWCPRRWADVPEGEYVIADPYGAMALIPENTSVDVKQLLTFYLAYTYNDPADPETYVDPDENPIGRFSAGHRGARPTRLWRTPMCSAQRR